MINIVLFITMIVSCVWQPLGAQSRKQKLRTEPEFVILITSYNNEKWAKDNLKSVCHQKSTRPYQVICINDCSSDKTREVMDKYVQKHHLESFVKLIHNEKRVGALENIYNAIHNRISDHKIVVSVDGDDRLAHDEVLLQLESRYRDLDLMITYGSALMIPKGTTYLSRRIPDIVFRRRELRQHKFVAQHLRTFKSGLFKKINKEDLMYDGKFFSMTWDMAFMLPMLEMAAPKNAFSRNRSMYIKNILYFYRVDNPLNDFRVNKELQTFLSNEIRKRPPYQPIEDL